MSLRLKSPLCLLRITAHHHFAATPSVLRQALLGGLTISTSYRRASSSSSSSRWSACAQAAWPLCVPWTQAMTGSTGTTASSMPSTTGPTGPASLRPSSASCQLARRSSMPWAWALGAHSPPYPAITWNAVFMHAPGRLQQTWACSLQPNNRAAFVFHNSSWVCGRVTLFMSTLRPAAHTEGAWCAG